MTFTSDTSHPGICAETAAAQALLDRFAAEAGADYAEFNRHTLPDGRVFYSASLQAEGNPRQVRSAHGDTLAEAMDAAKASEPFLCHPEVEAA